MRFSERYGHAQVRSVLQTNDIDQALRNRLWNVICSTFFEKVPKSQHNPSNFLSTQPFLGPLFLALWHDYFKTPIDAIGDSYIKSFGILREYFFKCPWHEVYDLIEFLTAHAGAHRQPGFVSSINKILKQELAGYRLVSGKIVQITAEEEIAAIEEALAVPDSLKPVREHLKQALALLADKKNP